MGSWLGQRLHHSVEHRRHQCAAVCGSRGRRRPDAILSLHHLHVHRAAELADLARERHREQRKENEILHADVPKCLAGSPVEAALARAIDSPGDPREGGLFLDKPPT